MEQVKIGIIGVTGRGKMAGSWHQPEGCSVVTAGMDVSEEALDDFRKNVNSNAYATRDIDDFLNRGDIDAVAVTSPDFTHEEYVVKSFESGKHVFCEKPMAITTEGCDRMLAAWKKSGKQFMVGFNMRYMSIFRKMKEIVDSGTIGKIKVVWCRHFVGTGGMWYYHDWHANSKNSTGLLLQKASHDIDMIHWITGQYTKRVSGFGSLDFFGGDKPNSLRCSECSEKDTCTEYSYNKIKVNKMDMCVFRKEVDVEDNSTIMMELENGIKATYMQCHYTPNYFRNYTFIGTEGSIENLDDSSKIVVKYRPWKNLEPQMHDIKKVEGGHGGADPVIYSDFIDMIQKGKKPVSTPLAGRMSVAAACAGTYSIRNNSKVVKIPPVPDDLYDFVS